MVSTQEGWDRKERLLGLSRLQLVAILTLVTMLVLGNILREIAIEMFEALSVWWAG